ncbi:hypothetical protein [Nioella sp.]
MSLPPHIAAVILLTNRPRKARSRAPGEAEIIPFPIVARPRR